MFKFQFKRYLFECKTAQQPIETKENTTTSQWELRVSGESWTFLRRRILRHHLPLPSPLGYPYKPLTLVVYVKGKFPFSKNVLWVFHPNQLLPHAFLGIQTCPVLPNTGREKATFKYFNKLITKYNWKKNPALPSCCLYEDNEPLLWQALFFLQEGTFKENNETSQSLIMKYQIAYVLWLNSYVN